MDKVDKISESFVLDYNQKHEEVLKLEAEIISRISYILDFLYELEWFSVNQVNWWFENAQEGEMGRLGLIDGGYITGIHVHIAPIGNVSYILKDGSTWNFDGGIPSRWLIEDFEQELIEGKAKFEKEKELQKIKNQEKRKRQKIAKSEMSIKDAIALEELKKKLSKEELEVLKRNL